MKIFILGRSGSGKTPFARKISQALDFQYIPASEWVKDLFDRTIEDRNRYIETMTCFSLQALRQRPTRCIEFIKSRYDLCTPSVIDGIRNPHDFINLYDPTVDLVVFLECLANHTHETVFEKEGLKVIRQYLEFLNKTGILAQQEGTSTVKNYVFDYYSQNTPEHTCDGTRSLDDIIEDFLTILPSNRSIASKSLDSASFIHANIRPIRVMVREEFLFDMDARYEGQLESGTLFALSSYPGHAPTFKILLDNGAIFSYIPVHALLNPSLNLPPKKLTLNDLVYHDCPLPEISIDYFDSLKGNVSVYFKRLGVWIDGDYIFTVDWYTGNDLLHFIALENGQYALVPSHKVKFGNSDRTFPPYKKLHQQWTVTTS